MTDYRITVSYTFQDTDGNPAEVLVYYFTKMDTESNAKLKIAELLGNNSSLRDIPYNGNTYQVATNTAVIVSASIVVRPTP